MTPDETTADGDPACARTLAAWTDGRWQGGRPEHITGFSQDSRQLGPGMMFVALRGDGGRDGHAFLSHAAAAGASGAMVAGDWPGTVGPLPWLRVDDPRRALGRAAAARRRACPRVRWVGITGSCGKTTVKEMICTLLRDTMAVYGSPGNWNNDIGLPLSLLNMPRGTACGVFELGTNHPGEIGHLCEILRPEIGVVTGIGPAHIGNFGTLEAIADEKGALVRSLPPDGLAVLNRDDGFYARIREQARCRRVSFSLRHADADYQGVTGADAAEWLRCRTAGQPQGVRVHVGVPGAHQACNALAALAVARALQVPWKQLAGIRLAGDGLPMRWQEATLGTVRVINDAYNANPLSMQCALDTFARLPGAPGRKILVLGDMFELGVHAERAHRTLGRRIAQTPWARVLLVGELSRWTAEAALQAGFDAGRLSWAPDAADAARVLGTTIRPGDCLLLKASRGMLLERALEGIET